jgi:hypothetical protein
VSNVAAKIDNWILEAMASLSHPLLVNLNEVMLSIKV